jgi:hypothetical protein
LPRQILPRLAWNESGEDVYEVSYRAREPDSNANAKGELNPSLSG